MALDAVRFQPAMHPEAVETGFLDRDDRHRCAELAFDAETVGFQHQQSARRVGGLDPVAGQFLTGRRVYGQHPVRLAQFKRYQDRGRLRSGGGGWLGRLCFGTHRMLLLKVEALMKTDLNDRRHFHPHRVLTRP